MASLSISESKVSESKVNERTIEEANDSDDDYMELIELTQRIFQLQVKLDEVLKEGYLSLSGARILLSKVGNSVLLTENGFPEYIEDTSAVVVDSSDSSSKDQKNATDGKGEEGSQSTLRNRFNNNDNIFPVAQRKSSFSSANIRSNISESSTKEEKKKGDGKDTEYESSQQMSLEVDKSLREQFLKQKWILRSVKQKDDLRDTITSFEKACNIAVELANIQQALSKRKS